VDSFNRTQFVAIAAGSGRAPAPALLKRRRSAPGDSGASDTATGAPTSGPAGPRPCAINAGSETGAPPRVIARVAMSICGHETTIGLRIAGCHRARILGPKTRCNQIKFFPRNAKRFISEADFVPGAQ